MLRKFASALLLLLAASPFTAPFSTCDAATLFGGTAASPRNHIHLSFTSADEQSTTLAVSTPRRTRERRKLFVPAAVKPLVDQRPSLSREAITAAPAAATALDRSLRRPLRI